MKNIEIPILSSQVNIFFVLVFDDSSAAMKFKVYLLDLSLFLV